MADDRVLATVLFTDIVDSTRRAAEMGDRDWHALLDAHDAVVRSSTHSLPGPRGEHLWRRLPCNVRRPAAGDPLRDGDPRPVQALGIEVRAGLHTGECEVRGDDIGGIAVHIGARVSALAGPNEVLVSSTLRDLVIGSGLSSTTAALTSSRACPAMASVRGRVCVAGRVPNRWGFVVFGDEGVVESSFCRNGFGCGVGAGVSAFGHHHPAVAGGLDSWLVGEVPAALHRN